MTDSQLIRAARDIFAAEYADAAEAVGFRPWGPGQSINQAIPEYPTDEELLPIIKGYVARLEEAWGMSIDSVWRLMLVPEDDRADCLYYCLMSCRGHGVGLEDDHGENLDAFLDATGEVLDTSPFHTELSDLHELAESYVEKILADEDSAPTHEDFHKGYLVAVETGLESGETLRCNARVFRQFDRKSIVVIPTARRTEPYYMIGRKVIVPTSDVRGFRHHA